MQTTRVNDYDMAYLEVGAGSLLVCVHGSLCDFRVWSPVLGLLSQQHRVIAPSLRHFFPEHWDGIGEGFSINQHVSDMIGFIAALDAGPVDLLGHSRGGHIAFRVALRRPDLVRRLVLAEPGGELDSSLAPPDLPPSPLRAPFLDAVAKVKAGDVDGGLSTFFDAIDGAGAWQRLEEATRQQFRDNAGTLVGQMHDGRLPFTRTDANALKVPALFVGGADTTGLLPIVLRALATQVPGARTVLIPGATHAMFAQRPREFCAAVQAFLLES